MRIDKIIIWGIGWGYQKICNALRWNEEIGNFEVIACVSKDDGQHDFDGRRVIKPEEMQDISFDYIIVSAEKYYQEIVTYGVETLKIDRNRFLHGKVFEIPCFDWKRYLTIYKSNISVISELCYGGMLCNHLGLPFNSPFVNVRVGDKSGYQKLISRLDYYMSASPHTGNELHKSDIITEGCVAYPILWYDDIMLHGFHYSDMETFWAKWEQRRKRYNPESAFVFKLLYGEDDLKDFDRLDIKHKIGFYFEDTGREQVITIPFDRKKYTYCFANCVNEFVSSADIFQRIDVFRLLSGEKEFKR